MSATCLSSRRLTIYRDIDIDINIYISQSAQAEGLLSQGQICKEKSNYNVVFLSGEQRHVHKCLMFRAQFPLAQKTEQSNRLNFFPLKS